MKAYTDTRDAVFGELYQIALDDPNVILLTADTGAFIFREFQKNLPLQFFNVGIAEQNAMSVAAGLALTGKKVFVFGITSFVTFRCFEQIKIDICAMNLPVTILGMGTGYGYSSDGPTHHVTQDISIMRGLPNMSIWAPADCSSTSAAVHQAYHNPGPGYIRIDKGPLTSIYDPETVDLTPGLVEVKPGSHLKIIATGPMVTQALKVREILAQQFVEVSIIDFYRLKPANGELLVQLVDGAQALVTLEEHTLAGGFGSLVLEILSDHGVHIPLKRIGIPETNRLEIGSREKVRSKDNLHLDGIVQTISDWLKLAQ